MKRVLIFARDAGWFGGVVNFIATLSKNLDNGFASVLFKIGRRKGIFGIVLRPVFPLIDAVRLVYLVLRERFDVYHINPSLTHSSLLRDGLFMLVLRLLRADNVIVSFHGWEDPVEKEITNSRLLLGVFRYIFGYADCTLVLAETFRNWLVTVAGFDPVRVRLFTTMFDDSEFSALRDDLVHDDNSVLFLSRLVREKGIYELVDAFRSLAPDYPDLKLVIAGNGPEEQRIGNYVSTSGLGDRVSFAGYVRGADKVRMMKVAGLFVLPTYSEGCPVSLLEAMAAGLPVITTPVGGIPHVVKEPDNGLFLDKVTPGEVEAAIRSLLENSSLRDAMRRTNIREAWAHYSATAVTRWFEDLYAGVGDIANVVGQ